MTAAGRKRYRKKCGAVVTAVQLDLDTQGFSYNKWGGQQCCKAGDWLVNNQGECYTIDQRSFADTYTRVSPGVYEKTQLVWAEIAGRAGTVNTREGSTDYSAGDYIVYNNAEGSDAYAVSKITFEQSYEPVAE